MGRALAADSHQIRRTLDKSQGERSKHQPFVVRPSNRERPILFTSFSIAFDHSLSVFRAAQDVVDQSLWSSHGFAVGVDKNPQRIIPGQQRLTLSLVDFVNPRAAHLADFGDPADDLHLVIVTDRAKIFDVVTSLENHPVPCLQFLQWMASQSYSVIVSLLDPIEKHRVMRPPERIEFVALHAAPRTIAVAIFHGARLVTMDSKIFFFISGREGDFYFLRQTQWPALLRIYIYPQRSAASYARAIYRTRDIVFARTGGSAAFGYPGGHFELVTIADLQVIADLQTADHPSAAAFFIPRKRISGVG